MLSPFLELSVKSFSITLVSWEQVMILIGAGWMVVEYMRRLSTGGAICGKVLCRQRDSFSMCEDFFVREGMV